MTHEPSVTVKSPLALVGVFLEVLRARFNAVYDMPWKYYPGDEGRSLSTIQIEAGGNEHSESNGKRPAIYVIRNPISFVQATIGDGFQKSFKDSKEFFYTMAQTGITVAIEALEAGEVEYLADIVLSTLLMGSDAIERTFQFRKLGPFALSSRVPSRQDTEVHQVSIQVGLSYDVRWMTYPIAPVLKEVVTQATTTYTNSDQYFTNIYQQSLASRLKK